MKFLHLHEAINSSGIDAKFRQPVKAANPRVGKPSKPQQRQDRIIGGMPCAPVNRQAAIVTSKASWIHRPPQSMNGNQTTKPNGNDRKNWDVDENGVMRSSNGQKLGDFRTAQLIQAEIHRKEFLKAQEKFVQELEDIERALTQYRSAVVLSTKQMAAASGEALSELRAIRMPIVSEVSQMLPALKEVRQFFIGADHSVEMARLREFVDLCERLQKLKESGFLDAVADTMIKLSVGESSK